MGEVLTVVSAISSVIGGIQAGNQADANGQWQQRQYEDAAKDEMLASTQEEVLRRRELNDTLSTIDAVRAGRGLSLRSPTGRVINKASIDNSYRDIGIGKTNRLIRADQNRQSGQYARSVGKAQKNSAIFEGVTKGVGGLYSLFPAKK